ncbi:hypothetical protein KFK09_003417 [Dendrobium nobile]|uniref:Uncharacterized protein n=1 Tax=Dendrobium nobile TaxID=94219 RepID=A0A8T3C052_DENNO|nr:hypothetical protein KFK09_003417 [Dendrobium nobile]
MRRLRPSPSRISTRPVRSSSSFFRRTWVTRLPRLRLDRRKEGSIFAAMVSPPSFDSGDFEATKKAVGDFQIASEGS